MAWRPASSWRTRLAGIYGLLQRSHRESPHAGTGAVQIPGRALQGEYRLCGARRVHPQDLGGMARPHCRLFRRPPHRPIRAAGKDTPRDSPLAQSIRRQATRSRLRHAGLVAGALPRRRDWRARQQSCDGIKRIYASDRSEIIWTDADIAQLKKTCLPEIAHAVDLAAHTGLRAGDLLRLCWSNIHEEDNEITIATSKSRGRQVAVIPLYDELREVLARIPKHSTVILTNSLHRPWKNFAAAFVEAKKAAGITNLHFHDLRGTAATRFYLANLPIRTIGEILGWTEESVEKIIRKYVARGAATRAVIRQLNEARRRT